MNLHNAVRGAIRVVNPDITATLLRSTGYTTGTDGKQTPTYTTLTGSIQVQGLSGTDLRHTDSLNIQGILRKVYINGNWAGIIRVDARGGDIMKFPQIPGAVVQDWRIVEVSETWDSWCSVIVCLQDSIT